MKLERKDWAIDVKRSLNDLLDLYGLGKERYSKNNYVVSDLDNTVTIFDTEEQCMIYQLQTMVFGIKPDEMKDVLLNGIEDINKDLSSYGLKNCNYDMLSDDIASAYGYLYKQYGPFSAEGIDQNKKELIQKDKYWLEFATKIRLMYDLVCRSESEMVSYPWALYWFKGMSEKEVYDLSFKAFDYYKDKESEIVTWKGPSDLVSKCGPVDYSWYSGISVSENIKELWKAFKENGIDVWVCSASAMDVVKAAIDCFGLHSFCKGVLAMTNQKDEQGRYLCEYDYEKGSGFYALEDGSWQATTTSMNTQLQGPGKVKAIRNTIMKEYDNKGPIAGFMDSSGDFNFCSEFESLKLVVCFNRANRNIKDAGALVGELAIYQRDVLGYDLSKAEKNNETLYVLQGRNENGLRSLIASNATIKLYESEEKLFGSKDNYEWIDKMKENRMSTSEILNKFSMKNSGHGFLEEYNGYHSIKKE